MGYLLHQTLFETAAAAPASVLLVHDKHGEVSAAGFAAEVRALAARLMALGIQANDRVAVFLPKLPLTAYAFYAVTAAGGVVVPVNPILKPAQVEHILNDCDVRVLITSAAGGVGVATVQLARARGLITFGTAGPGKQEFLRQIGVDHPIDYTRQSAREVVRRVAPEGIEMAFDAVGGKSFAESYRCLGPMGRLVVYGFSTAVGESGKINYLRAAREMWQTPRFRPIPLIEKNIAIIGVGADLID